MTQPETMKHHGDSCCGIYCGACSVLRHGETGHGDGFVACCGSVAKEEIACGGCTSDRLYAGCRVCAIRDCVTAKGISCCVECADYPCQAYRRWQLASRLLPHVGEAPASLAAIKRDGAEAWLAAQKKRWACPGCGAPFSWYQAVCTGCGRDLGAAAYAMSGLRRLLCRFVLPMVYRKGKGRTPA